MTDNGAMDNGTVRRRVVVDGRVKGVFFRDTCRREANRHGVAGWARNLEDGRVEVVAEGRPDAVEQLVTWCRIGPRQAMVTKVEVTDEQPEGLVSFRIR